MMEDVARPLAAEIICFVLGLKNKDAEFKIRIGDWADHAADTGERHAAIENATFYMDGFNFFLETFPKVEKALKNNDEPDYDFNGIIPKFVKDKKITDPTEMAS